MYGEPVDINRKPLIRMTIVVIVNKNKQKQNGGSDDCKPLTQHGGMTTSRSWD